MTLLNVLIACNLLHWDKALKKASNFVLAFGVIAVPLQPGNDWVESKFGKVPANTVSFSDNSLQIEVQSSASPLFFRIGKVRKIKSLAVSGNVSKNLKTLPNKKERIDDFPLRFGLVEEGENSLSWMQRLFAPSWVKELSELDADGGLKKIHFLNLSFQMKKGESWTHPEFDFIEETIVSQIQNPGPFSFTQNFNPPIPCFAFWIQADGDQSGSDFTVSIDKIEYTIAP